jgi:hypothetical protein
VFSIECVLHTCALHGLCSIGVFGEEEEGGGVKSGPGAASTILLFHTISPRPSKQPRMVGSTLGVYSFGLIFVSARTNKRHHHLLTIDHLAPLSPGLNGAGWSIVKEHILYQPYDQKELEMEDL